MELFDRHAEREKKKKKGEKFFFSSSSSFFAGLDPKFEPLRTGWLAGDGRLVQTGGQEQNERERRGEKEKEKEKKRNMILTERKGKVWKVKKSILPSFPFFPENSKIAFTKRKRDNGKKREVYFQGGGKVTDDTRDTF